MAGQIVDWSRVAAGLPQLNQAPGPNNGAQTANQFMPNPMPPSSSWLGGASMPTRGPSMQPMPMPTLNGGASGGMWSGPAQMPGMGGDVMSRIRQLLGGMQGGAMPPMAGVGMQPGMMYAGGTPNFDEAAGRYSPPSGMMPAYMQPRPTTMPVMPGMSDSRAMPAGPMPLQGTGPMGSTLSQIMSRARGF